LQNKGRLYFGRDPVTGFYIRIPEYHGTDQLVFDINIVGQVNRYGEVHEFPKKRGHFPVILPNPDPEATFAVELRQHIPAAGMQAGDLLILVSNQKAVPGDIGIFWFGNCWLLVSLHPVDQDPDTPWYTMSKESDPEAIREYHEAGYLYWWPLAVSDDTLEYLVKSVTQTRIQWQPLAPKDILAVAVQLERPMTI
jgi:hypothetical protein